MTDDDMHAATEYRLSDGSFYFAYYFLLASTCTLASTSARQEPGLYSSVLGQSRPVSIVIWCLVHLLANNKASQVTDAASC